MAMMIGIKTFNYIFTFKWLAILSVTFFINDITYNGLCFQEIFKYKISSLQRTSVFPFFSFDF